MGVGCNRMNVYTVRAAIQGLANYINQQARPLHGHSALIGYDSRNNSRLFAEEAAKTLATNGIKVFIYSNIRPSPLVSYGCRLKQCTAAIMITASHNPPAYNGLKVYWNDGGQVLPPHDKCIMQEVAKITDPSTISLKNHTSISDPWIEWIDNEIDLSYLDQVSQLQHYPKENIQFGHELQIVYTSLHGTGITLVPKLLSHWGFSNLAFVDEQNIPDGNFPTVLYPNPEEEQAMSMGIEKLKASQSDILIATDPDADRVGVAVRHHHDIVLLNGNQIACLCLAHICEALYTQKKMPENAAFIKSVVTSELFQAICDAYNKPCINVLTGFKYIAEKIREWENNPNGKTYVFGGEDSYGYLLGTFTRDKDAVLMSALICEMALKAKREGKTLIDQLHDLYRKFGVYYESQLSVQFEETKAGRELMANGMKKLRTHVPKHINHVDIVSFEDYASSKKTDMVILFLADGSKLIVRPSGTEPKIKIYCGVIKKDNANIETALQDCQIKAKQLLQALQQLLKT